MLAEFMSLQVSSVFMMMYASVCGAGHTFMFVYSYNMAAEKEKQTEHLRLAVLAARTLTECMPVECPACAFVHWYFPVCTPSVRAQCSSAMYGNPWSKGLS